MTRKEGIVLSRELVETILENLASRGHFLQTFTSSLPSGAVRRQKVVLHVK
jgi:hypothetical protein